jgi:hypothetical protein
MISDNHLSEVTMGAFVQNLNLGKVCGQVRVEKDIAERLLDLAGLWIGRMVRDVQKESVIRAGNLFFVTTKVA